MLPILSKLYERLVHNQVVKSVETHHLLADKVTGLRKSHSTSTVLFSMLGHIKSNGDGQNTDPQSMDYPNRLPNSINQFFLL